MSSPVDMQPEDDRKKHINGHCKGGIKLSTVISIALSMVLIVVLIALKKNVIEPFRRGFFCSDVSIRYPVVEDTLSTGRVVISFGFMLILIVFVGEWLKSSVGMLDVGESSVIRKTKTGTKPFIWIQKYLTPRKWFFSALKFFFVYMWAVLASQVLVNILKHSLGTLRPNFFARCNPNVKCQNEDEQFLYHTEYVCQGITSKEEASLRTSFPSGHSAFSATTALFLVCYIQKKMNKPISFTFFGSGKELDTIRALMALAIQYVCFEISIGTSLLRILDYKHHLLDVIVGYVLGGIIGYSAAYHYLRWDSVRRTQKNSSADINDRSSFSVQELVEMNGGQDNEIRKQDEDVGKDVMEYENESNLGNGNLTKQRISETTASE